MVWLQCIESLSALCVCPIVHDNQPALCAIGRLPLALQAGCPLHYRQVTLHDGQAALCVIGRLPLHDRQAAPCMTCMLCLLHYRQAALCVTGDLCMPGRPPLHDASFLSPGALSLSDALPLTARVLAQYQDHCL